MLPMCCMSVSASPLPLLPTPKRAIVAMAPWRQRAIHKHSGFTVVEPLIVSVIVVLAMVGSVAVIQIANRRFAVTQQRVQINREIDTDIQAIKHLARRYTCCSGTCSTSPPSAADTQLGVGGKATKSCVTADWRSRNYYTPARDDPETTALFAGTNPGTSSEVNAVDQICQTANNTTFMTPFQTAVTSTAIPPNANWSRATTIQTEKTLRITYTDTINNVTVRTEYIQPAMAAYCSASN